LTHLERLILQNCGKIRYFHPIRRLLETLKNLCVYGCSFADLPVELCGDDAGDNAIDRLRAHYADLELGAENDRELKLFILGNGGVGKTQLCRRLRDLPFDPTVPSTHGIQLERFPISLGEGQTVQVCFWDFGGQDIYHGTHALFLQGHAVFVVLWHPDCEGGETTEGGVVLRNRPLAYWLDYIRGLAGTDCPLLVVQGQCDRASARRQPAVPLDDFRYFKTLEFSARTDLGLDALRGLLKESIRNLLEDRPLHQIGVGRLQVRDRLRAMLAEDQELPPGERQHRTLSQNEFRVLCDQTGGKVNDPEALLDFLHRCGVVFYRPGLFEERIILDQAWALEAIYTLFHRRDVLPELYRDGRFTRAQLAEGIWRDMPVDDQETFLGMMRSCGICFRARNLSGDARRPKWEYVAPDLLPEWSQAKAQLLGRERQGEPDDQATVCYRFLHEGILRTFLSRIGEQAGDAAVYWKYGCWFCEERTRAILLVQSDLERREVTLQAWGQEAATLVERMLKTLRDIPVGHPPEVIRATPQVPLPERREGARGIEDLNIVPRSRLPDDGKRRVYLSYAWGDTTPEGRQREEVVDRLYERLRALGYDVIRDKNAMRSGDLISTFMKAIGKGDRVVVVLSAKYLRSVYCVTELHEIYRESRGQKDDFLRRIVPLTLADVSIGSIVERAGHARHWKKQRDEIQPLVAEGLLAPSDYEQWARICRWVMDVPEMLAHINDMLHPVGFDAIVADDFAGVKALLERNA
jgi:internalin A